MHKKDPQWARATDNRTIRLQNSAARRGPYPAAPGFVINGTQVEDPIRTEWYNVLYPEIEETDLEETASSVGDNTSASEISDTDTIIPSATSPGKGKAKEGSTPVKTPLRKAPPPRKSQGAPTQLPRTPASPISKARVPKSNPPTADPSLQRHITLLLQKIAQPGMTDEVAEMGAMLSLGATDLSRVPQNLETTISELVASLPDKKVTAVVCAITALIIHNSGVAHFRSSTENVPILHLTMQSLLSLLSSTTSGIHSAKEMIIATVDISEGMVKAILRKACKDSPEVVETIAASAIAMVECWGNKQLSQYAGQAFEVSSSPSTPTSARNSRRVPATPSPSARSSTPAPMPRLSATSARQTRNMNTPTGPASSTLTRQARSPSPEELGTSVSASGSTRAKVNVILTEKWFTHAHVPHLFYHWSSTSNRSLKAPVVPDEERDVVGIYIHTTIGQGIQCWLNNPKKRQWKDITDAYNKDDGTVLHPQIETHCLTKVRGPTFILWSSFTSRKEKKEPSKKGKAAATEAT